jgi:restriction system protein
MGYHVAHAAPPGADGGIDIIAYPDPLGTKEPTIKVSVRRRTAKADLKDIREFLANLHGSDVGIFISVAGFTSEAEKACRSDQRRIRLLDAERLFDMWIKHYEAIDESSRKLMPIRPVYFLAIETT